jgi:hypothetical protein
MLNNNRDIKKVVVKLNNNKEEVMRLFLAITAKWCGACHAVSDRLNKAIKGTRMAATRIDEQNVSRLNDALNSSIEPPHYPYFIVMNQQGKIHQVLSSIEEVEQFLASTPRNNETQDEESGTDPKPVSRSNKSPSTTVQPESVSRSNNAAESKPVTRSNKSPSIIPDKSLSVEVEEEEEEVEPNASMKQVSNMPQVGKLPSATPGLANQKIPNPVINANASGSALPPNARKIDAIQAPAPSEPLSPVHSGGSLYANLASTAYQLAPPAILMGLAAATLKCKSKKRKARRTQRK